MLLYKCLFQRINYLYKIEDTDGGDRRKIEDFGEVNFPISIYQRQKVARYTAKSITT